MSAAHPPVMLRFGVVVSADATTKIALVRFAGGNDPHPVRCVGGVPTAGTKIGVWSTPDRMYYLGGGSGGGVGPAGPIGPVGPAGPIGPAGPAGPSGTGAPASRAGAVGDTYRQIDANPDYGNLPGLLWLKQGNGTALLTDWVPDFEGRWIAYAPAWTATGGTPVLGNGALSGGYTRRGNTVEFRCTLAWGSSTSAGTTKDWRLSPPTTVASTGPVSGYAYKGGDGYYILTGLLASGSGGIRGLTTSNQYIEAAVPHAWASGNTLIYAGTYQTN